MKKIASTLICLISASAIFAQNQDSILFKKTADEILWHGTCYDNLRVLTKTIGHRLSGSPEAEKAVLWGKKAMEAAGADKVWLQPVEVPYWVRGAESLKIRLHNDKYEPVTMLSLGNTEGTSGKVLEAEIVCVPDLEHFAALSDAQIKGKIIFFNHRFRQDIINTFQGYGDAVIYRGLAVNKASARGAAAVIIRSVSTGADDVPHTGMSHYSDTTRKIPAVAIGNFSADALEKACTGKTIHAQLTSNCGMKGTKRSYNVIGEITGSNQKDKIITVGGHLDSWDVGEGAQDDGAGCVQSIEVIRTLKALHIQPQHTVRAVLFMNEENGARGGNAYADSAMVKKEQHIFALESDAGGFVPRGVGLEMNDSLKQIIRTWSPLFQPYGVWDFMQEESGTDISPLKKLNVPLAGLLPDPQRYFDLHHSSNDVFEAVSHRELKLGAWTMLAMVMMIDKNF